MEAKDFARVDPQVDAANCLHRPAAARVGLDELLRPHATGRSPILGWLAHKPTDSPARRHTLFRSNLAR